MERLLDDSDLMARVRSSSLIMELGASDFAPASISGLVAWWDFTDRSTLWKNQAATVPVTADGDIILAVTDKSGHGNIVTDVTAGPTYKVNITNGNSVGRFDGVNDFLWTDNALSTSLSEPYTAFLVGTQTALGEVNSPWTDGTAGRAHLVLGGTGVGAAFWGMFFGGGVTASTKAEDTNPHVFDVVAQNSAIWRCDGGADRNGGVNGGNPSLTNFQFCSNSKAGGSSYAAVDFMHVLLYSGQMSNSNMNVLGSYLASKAGTTWTPVS